MAANGMTLAQEKKCAQAQGSNRPWRDKQQSKEDGRWVQKQTMEHHVEMNGKGKIAFAARGLEVFSSCHR
jgi:hypothetical protein